MSFRATAWAMKQKARNATQKLVLMILADYADEHGVCFPHQSLIAEKAGLHRITVVKALKALRDDKLIADRRRGRATGKGGCQANIYTLQILKGGLSSVRLQKVGLCSPTLQNPDGLSAPGLQKVGGFCSAPLQNHSKEEPITSKEPITQERARAQSPNMGERFAALSQALAAGMDAGLDRRPRSLPASLPGTSADELKPVEAAPISDELVKRLKSRVSPPAKPPDELIAALRELVEGEPAYRNGNGAAH